MSEPEKKISVGPSAPAAPPTPKFVKYHHKKSGFFRVVYADGAWGGANNTGVIHLTFYSEHIAIPGSVTYPVGKDGKPINPPTIEGDEGFQREMEIDVALPMPAAVQVRNTLDAFIKIATENMNVLKRQMEGEKPQVESK